MGAYVKRYASPSLPMLEARGVIEEARTQIFDKLKTKNLIFVESKRCEYISKKSFPWCYMAMKYNFKVPRSRVGRAALFCSQTLKVCFRRKRPLSQAKQEFHILNRFLFGPDTVGFPKEFDFAYHLELS